MVSDVPPVVAVVGPTAAGKSLLALRLAQAFDGEIINADSRQVYRHMDIGTAKPRAEDRRLVPHHLLDLVEPNEGFDLATFLRLAQAGIDDVADRKKMPIVVGGTGQYVWALLEGWELSQTKPDATFRRSLEEESRQTGPEALHSRLAQVDPQTAAGIHPQNLRRIIRALEVQHYSTSPSPSRRQKSPPPFQSLVVGLTVERKRLYELIDQRVDGMMEQGLVAEVRHLTELGYAHDLPAFSSAGYKEIFGHLQGRVALSVAIQQVKYATHRLARRQYAWFRPRDTRIHWLDVESDPYERAESMVSKFLAGCASYGTMSNHGS